MLRCAKCCVFKDNAEFFRNRTQSSGHHPYCKSCTKEYDAQRYPNGKPGKRKRYFRKTYGLSLEELDKMSAAQDGKCAICAKTPSLLVVDHDHSTGAVRGLLCHQCNRTLGLLGEDIECLLAMIEYLRQHQEVS